MGSGVPKDSGFTTGNQNYLCLTSRRWHVILSEGQVCGNHALQASQILYEYCYQAPVRPRRDGLTQNPQHSFSLAFRSLFLLSMHSFIQLPS